MTRETEELVSASAGRIASTLTVALAQGSFRVGNLTANRERIAAFHRLASRANADLIVFPELALSGYPPQDLLFDRDFLARHEALLEQCVELTRDGCAILLGAVRRDGGMLRNSAFLCSGGQVAAIQDKCNLPNEGVFDEKRYYVAGEQSQVMALGDFRLGILICEDAWTPRAARAFADAGAEILLCLNASPFEMEKRTQREGICKMRVQECGLPLVYLNLAAAQDDLIFDGCSFVMNAEGEVTDRLAAFREDFHLVRFVRNENGLLLHSGANPEAPGEDEMAYRALVFGLREFANANGYRGAVLGLSGGIDSALAAAIAVDAFGAGRIEALFLPSPVTSPESREDAMACAAQLGIVCDDIAIDAGMRAFADMAGPMPDTALEENQTRIRANLLLARARKSGKLLLNTGNKSELATGYTTIYGDLCGHYAPLKDVYKTHVYRLAAWRNASGAPIPQRIFDKAPSAELKPGQRDEDVLPAYPVLDSILECILERGLTVGEIVEQGHERNMVLEVHRMLDAAEYKRRQAPPGPKITRKALAHERRYPISNGWYVERGTAGKVFTRK